MTGHDVVPAQQAAHQWLNTVDRCDPGDVVYQLGAGQNVVRRLLALIDDLTAPAPVTGRYLADLADGIGITDLRTLATAQLLALRDEAGAAGDTEMVAVITDLLDAQ